MKKAKVKAEDKVFDYQTICNKDTPVAERRKMYIGDIWSNSIKCKKCNTVIRSKNLHNYVTCKCGAISIDGGSWHSNVNGYPEDMENLVEYFNILES